MTTLCIVGAGGHGAVVAEAADLMGRWQAIRFIDERVPDSGLVLDWPVSARESPEKDYGAADTHYVVAVGNNRVRCNLQAEIRQHGGQIVSVIHPTAVVSRFAHIKPGSVVFAHAVINARATLAGACLINTGATVDHDCTLADGVHVSPGANVAGGVSIGARTWVGLGASVRQYLTIGEDVVVGASAAVVSDVASGTTVVGVPARVRD